jgi:hypothetical protein
MNVKIAVSSTVFMLRKVTICVAQFNNMLNLQLEITENLLKQNSFKRKNFKTNMNSFLKLPDFVGSDAVLQINKTQHFTFDIVKSKASLTKSVTT